MTNLNNTNID